MINVLALIVVIAVVNLISFRLLITLLQKKEVVALNYRQEKVPSVYGLIFTIAITLSLLAGSLLKIYSFEQVNRLLIIILTMSLVGIIDDLIGSKKTQGLQGHFKALLTEFRLTTGGLKAIFGGLIIIFVSLNWYSNIVSSLINGLVILLSANFINLVDLRPGRAWKVSLIMTSLVVVGNPGVINWSLLILVTGLIMLPFDLQAQGMMGDIGANVLGAVIGFMIVISFSNLVKLIWVSGLFLIHLYTEYNSITNLIKNNQTLSYLDQLGRRN